jgi:chemotaxis protein histidine kinase CheA
MENIQDTPETAPQSPGLDKALDAAYDSGEGEEDTREEPTEVEEPTEEVEESTEAEESTPEEEHSEESLQKLAEEDEESFTSLDPEKLPDEVKPFYKSLQAAFTKKRQADAEKVKEMEERLQTASKAQKTVEEVNALIKRAREGDESAFRQLMQMDAQQQMSEEERIRQVVQQEREEAFYKEAQSEYPKLDRRLDDTSPSYDPMMDRWLRAQLAESLDTHWDKEGTSLGFDYKAEGKSLIGKWDKYLVDKNTAYLKKQSEMAKKKSEESKKKSPKTSKAEASPNRKMSLDEAVDAAIESVEG